MTETVTLARPTPTLNDARNDTGRVAFCGPYVLSAISGFPISRIEDVIRQHREVPAGRKPVVRGTYADEVEAALSAFGYRMDLKDSFMHLARKARPSLLAWMQKPRSTWSSYILAIHKGKEGHWILVRGVRMCDTFTEGRWTFVVDGPHRGCRIMEVFEVKRATDALDRTYDFAGRPDFAEPPCAAANGRASCAAPGSAAAAGLDGAGVGPQPAEALEWWGT